MRAASGRPVEQASSDGFDLWPVLGYQICALRLYLLSFCGWMVSS